MENELDKDLWNEICDYYNEAELKVPKEPANKQEENYVDELSNTINDITKKLKELTQGR